MEHMMSDGYCWHWLFACLLMTAFFILGIASFVKYLFYSKKK